MHRLALGDAGAAAQLIRRTVALHAAPETLALWRIVAASSRRSGDADAGEPRDA